MTIWTLGHSTQPLAEFMALLDAHGIGAIADVRRFPGSRKFPHFAAESLARALEETGRRYLPFPELGGRRKPRADSRNTGWRSAGFRGYADYMETQEFGAAIARLLEASRPAPTAVMCAEAAWWRCHRMLIADYLKAMGVTVLHIPRKGPVKQHPYTSAARVVEGVLTYAAP
jgi:uncharacterized protein (DUF488 family)